MAEIKLDFKNSGVTQKSIMEYKAQVEIIHKDLHRRANDEKDFVGWLDLPTNYDKDEFERIKKAAKKIKKESDILVVIGIGGSYLGARAVIEALTSSFNNMLSAKQRKYPQILYVGNNLSPNYINELIEYIGDKDFSINVISSSELIFISELEFSTARTVSNKHLLPSCIYCPIECRSVVLFTPAGNIPFCSFPSLSPNNCFHHSVK